jgi:ribokinase
MHTRWLSVMGSFVADLAFRTPALPLWGQTILGSEFRLGPGGKGSNQAVAAARLGGRVTFISKLGRDAFGDLARSTYRDEGIDTQFCFESPDQATGAASIVVHETKGENAIVVVPGSSFSMTLEEVDQAGDVIKESAMFLTQLELPLNIVVYGLELARSFGVPTILNPAPARDLPEGIYPLCDYFTPNETEAAALVGHPIASVADAERAAGEFLDLGVRNAIITLGAEGALVRNADVTRHVPAFDAGAVVETTGAGDAFNGGLAIALTEGLDVVAATRFGCAVAGISVTRHGTAPSMPSRAEVDALLEKGA